MKFHVKKDEMRKKSGSSVKAFCGAYGFDYKVIDRIHGMTRFNDGSINQATAKRLLEMGLGEWEDENKN